MMTSLKLELSLTVSTGPKGGQGYWQARPCQPHGQACQQGRQEDQEGQEVDVTIAVPLLLKLDCRCHYKGRNVLKNRASFRFFSSRKDEGKVEKEEDEEAEEKEEEDEGEVMTYISPLM